MAIATEHRDNPELLDEVEIGETAGLEATEEVILSSEPKLKEVIILLPALDEEEGIGLVLDSIPFESLQEMGCEVSVLVVDGESTDATCQIAQEKGAHILVQTGEGKGNGVRQAFARIRRQWSVSASDDRERYLIMLDSDGTYPVEDIPLLVDALRVGNDVVMGSRLRGKIEAGAMTGLNYVGNRILTLLARLLFRVPVTDVCTGMWGFSQDFLERCQLEATGFELEAEIFASAAALGAKLTEVPIEYRIRHGEPKMIPLETGFEIARCLLRKRFGSRRREAVAMPVQPGRPQGSLS